MKNIHLPPCNVTCVTTEQDTALPTSLSHTHTQRTRGTKEALWNQPGGATDTQPLGSLHGPPWPLPSAGPGELGTPLPRQHSQASAAPCWLEKGWLPGPQSHPGGLQEGEIECPAGTLSLESTPPQLLPFQDPGEGGEKR